MTCRASSKVMGQNISDNRKSAGRGRGPCFVIPAYRRGRNAKTWAQPAQPKFCRDFLVKSPEIAGGDGAEGEVRRDGGSHRACPRIHLRGFGVFVLFWSSSGGGGRAVELGDREPRGARRQRGVAAEAARSEGRLRRRRHLLQGVPRRRPGAQHQGLFPPCLVAAAYSPHPGSMAPSAQA
jgi:hypothetical protein